MRAWFFLASVVVLAIIAAGYFYFTLPPDKQVDTRREFAKIILQGGVIGALGLAGKKLLEDWQKRKEQAYEQAIRRHEQFKARQNFLATYLKVLRKRFRLALGRMDENDRLNFPKAWAVNLIEGGSREEVLEDSHDLTAVIRILLNARGFHQFERDIEEVSKLLVDFAELKGTLPDKQVDLDTWSGIKDRLCRAYELIDKMFWNTALGEEEVGIPD